MVEIQDKVTQLVSKQLNVDISSVKPESSFLDTVELVMALEEAFGIEIPDEEAENIKTIQNVVDYIADLEKKPIVPSKT